MLVEINLLPEKETKKKSLFLLAIISIVIVLVGGIFTFWLNKTFENKISSIEGQISTTEQLIALQQQKMTSYQSSDSLHQLEQMIEWANQYPIKKVPIFKKMTELLPERGFIQEFNYEDRGMIQLTVQFESSREAAFYLNHLHQSDWVESAKLNSVNAETRFYDKQMGETIPDEYSINNEEYIPRYMAEYEVTINKEVINQDQDSQTSEQKEGEDS